MPLPGRLQGWLLLISFSFACMSSGTSAQNFEECLPTDGCAVLVPQYWTTQGQIQFNFSGLEEGGALNDFSWGVGSQPGALDTVPSQAFATPAQKFSQYNIQQLDAQNVTINGTSFTNQTLYILSATLAGQALIDGRKYYVNVIATDVGGIAVNATSAPVTVATSVPVLNPQGYIYNSPDCGTQDSQRSTRDLWACWDSFNDTVTEVVSYAAQAREYRSSGNIGDLVQTGLNRKVQITNLSLSVGSRYYVEVFATNAAGLVGSASGQPLTILGDSDGLSTVGLTFVVAGSIIAVALLLFLIGYLFFRRRYNTKLAQRKLERERMRVLKTLMYSLVQTKNGDGLSPAEQLRNARQLAFVTTDLQSSTSQASASPHGFLKVQEIHDTVIREGIAKHNGYEINTEGDAFHIAFSTVPQAVLFAMETQYRLLDTAWPREVIKLPDCNEVYDRDGTLLFRGPRVRMGVHYAAEGTVAHRLHLLTKHRVFSGPGFQVAVEVGDAANGGQVLLTHDAWLKLEAEMALAGFPTVKQIGLYQLRSWPTPIWLYEVSQLLGRHLPRSHKELRKVTLLETGWGLNIVPSPEPREGRVLTFVCMRLEMPKMEGRSAEGGSIRASLSHVVSGSSLGPPATPLEVSPQLGRQLFEALATCTMQFRGYIHLVRENQGIFGAVFQQTLDAVRFAHAAQTRLLYTPWQNAAKDRHFGPVEFTPDGRLLFYGPRIAMAIHETSDFEAEKVALPSQGLREMDMHYFGGGVEFTQALGKATHGGQVVLSESAWASIQDQLPGSSQVISLGTHLVCESVGGPMLLMEVMPTILGRRSFPKPATLESIEPGYRDSPDPSTNMALVFMKVVRPPEVQQAEQAHASISDGDMIRALTAFNIANGKLSRLVRQLLSDFDGYECKEPEPGKFTLAFHTLEAAVRWAAVLQKELLEVAWPEVVLEWPECAEAYFRHTSGEETLLWKGLRVRIGMACGKPQYRKPLNTGRADYYGSLPNLAARVAALAQPGQILVEGTSGFTEAVRWISADNVGMLPMCKAQATTNDEEDIELHVLGFYLLKGLDDPKPIIQATPVSLTAREFGPLAAAMKVGAPAKRHKSGSMIGIGSFLSMASTSDSHSNGPSFAGLARSGSKMLGNMLHDLHVPGMKKPHKSLPTPTPSGGIEQERKRTSGERELQLMRSERGMKSPWGSFADHLAERVRAVGEIPRSSMGSQRSELPTIAGTSPLQAEILGMRQEGGEAASGPTGSPDSDWHLPSRVGNLSSRSHSIESDLPKRGSTPSTGSALGGSLRTIFSGRSSLTPTNSNLSANLDLGAAPGLTSSASFRSQSMPRVRWYDAQQQRQDDEFLQPFPSVVSSPPALIGDEGGRRHSGIHSATESYQMEADSAQELAMTFAASRGSLGPTQREHLSTPRGVLRRIDTPITSIHATPAVSPAGSIYSDSLDPQSRRALAEQLRETISSASTSSAHGLAQPRPAHPSAELWEPREVKPRSAAEMEAMEAALHSRTEGSSHGRGDGSEGRRSDSRDLGDRAGSLERETAEVGEPPGPSRGGSGLRQMMGRRHSDDDVYEGPEASENSMDGAGKSSAARFLALAPRSSSASSKVSRATVRRNAVLDVAHRRQVAQEGLMPEDQRTWSYATEGKQGSEIATVPEEEIELSQYAANNDQNV